MAMKRVTLWVLLLWLCAGVARADDAWLTGQKRAYQLDRASVDRLLGELWRRYPDFHERLRAVALLRVGTPYVLGCLGEEKGRDRDPVFRLDQADCTVHVLTSSALAHAHTWAEARGWMVRLNYYPGKDAVRYENRVHFTEDRLAVSPWFFDLTPGLLPASRLQQVTLTLNRTREGKRLLDVPWEKRMTVRYVALATVDAALLDRLPPHVAGVAFVRRGLFPKGLAIAHEGLVLDRRWLVHADSVSKAVRRVALLDYLKRNTDWFDGVIFYGLR